MKRLYLLTFGVLFFFQGISQKTTKLPVTWRALLIRDDNNQVAFNLHKTTEHGRTVLYVTNGAEKIMIHDVKTIGDSLFFNMPAFESSFRAKILPDGSLQGIWIKGTASKTQYWPFYAHAGQRFRFVDNIGFTKENITGRWAITFTRSNNNTRPAVAEFVQDGNFLTGTFLTPNGDYRYLEGIVTGDSMKLSVFDGAHAYLFMAKIDSAQQINGMYYAGIAGKEKWTARKDAHAALPEGINTPQLKKGEERLNFSFRDIDSAIVSINDERFKNKVVIVQLMGSWCPNCMDETKFLSEYYSRNKERGIEIVGLGYENSTDFERSQKTLRKFQQLYNVEYPMLITGVAVNDSLRTEKTFPQITPIKAFPTNIFLDKKGKVRKIHAGFYGPGTGKHYEEFKKEFYTTVDKLVKEK